MTLTRSQPLRLISLGLVFVLLISGCSARKEMTSRGDHLNLANSEAAAPDLEDVELGPTDPSATLNFTVSLVLPGQADLNRFLEDLHDPQSPEYRHFLKADAFGQRFGLALPEIDDVVAWLGANGISVDFRPAQRTSLGVRGSVADVNKLFGVTLVDWKMSDGRVYHRPDSDAKLPADMATRVAHVVGLDTQPLVRPAFVPSPILAAGVLHGGLTPADVARAYEIEPLHQAGFNGEGETVAIMSLSPFNQDDVAEFDRLMGITGPAVQNVALPGSDSEPNGNVGEVMLDIEVVRGIAPAAQIINYSAADDLASFGPLIARVVDEGKAHLANLSYGWCERYYPDGVIDANEKEFSAAFAQGISVFVSSGDEGGYECWRALKNKNDALDRDIRAAVASPTSSPSVISVGGTFLSVRADGTYYREAGWAGPFGLSGGGGGLSTIYPRPSWQTGAGVDNGQSNGMRQVPDVAGPADPASGFVVVSTEPEGKQSTDTVGGTSAAAPFWAASMALVSQLAKSKGIDALGSLGPVLYQVAAARPDVFHDVVHGGNLAYDAAPGWDYATGLGSPRVAALGDAIVAALGGQ